MLNSLVYCQLKSIRFKKKSDSNIIIFRAAMVFLRLNAKSSRSKIMSKSIAMVLFKITSCRSTFFAFVLSDNHYGIFCAMEYDDPAEQRTPVRSLSHCFMTREYLMVPCLPPPPSLSPCTTGSPL